MLCCGPCRGRRDVAGLVVVVGVVAPDVVIGRALVMADAPWAASDDNRVAASDHPGAGVSVLCVVEPANVAKGAVLVGAGAAAATTMEVAADFVCTGVPLSLTVAVKLEVPLVVGVPEMIPVVAARVSP